MNSFLDVIPEPPGKPFDDGIQIRQDKVNFYS
jgi:hypothetical protein